MNLTDEQFLDIVERSEKIFDKLLNELSNEQLNLIRKDLDNLSVDQKVMNQLLIDRINYLKQKKLTKPVSYFSSGELDLSNIKQVKENSKKIGKPISYFSSGELDLFNFQQAKDNSKKISKSASYFSSGELELLQSI